MSDNQTRFKKINQDHLAMIQNHHSQTRLEEYANTVREVFDKDGAHNIRSFKYPFVFDEGDFEILSNAGSKLLEIQSKILVNHFKSKTKEEILRYFLLPISLSPWIDWGSLFDGQRQVVRFDIILSESGKYQFCELNIDSAVGGIDLEILGKEYLRLFPSQSHRSLKSINPLKSMTKMIEYQLKQKNYSRLVLLDWSTWENQGYLSSQTLENYLKSHLKSVHVESKFETEYFNDIKSQSSLNDLVYRCFLYDDVKYDLNCIDPLLRKGSQTFNTFETEILSNKIWLSMFHQDEFRSTLSSEEKEIIDTYIPSTFNADQLGIARMLERKDEYVLKACQSFGGKAVYLGKNYTAAELLEIIQREGSENWIIQKYIPSFSMSWPTFSGNNGEEFRFVFGIFSIFGESSGVLVRAHSSSEVVNVASGGALSWGIILESLKGESNEYK